MMNSNGVQRLTLHTTNHPTGPMTHYLDFAAYPWQPWNAIPDRPDGQIDETGDRSLKWPILAYYEGDPKPVILYYWEGRWRSASGNIWRGPHRWAYVRHTPEIWHEALQQFVVPGLHFEPAAAPPPGAGIPKSLQYIVDGLKIRYTTKEIMDAMDASPFDEPSEGAPLPTGPVAP
jgi:hypothetical protein